MTDYNPQEVARFMISYSHSRLPMQMLARGESPSTDLCQLVQAKYEQEVPQEIRLAVEGLEQTLEDGE
jgi:hypothetical protein